MRLIRLPLIVMLLAPLAPIAFADDTPASQPATEPSAATIKASDKDAITANMDKDVVIEGVIDKAEWSATGKVMKATFKDGADSKLSAIIFVKNRDAFDKAFSGDVTKALDGASVRIKGKLKEYRDAPEIVLDSPDQITIVQPATQPS
jgi:hypothetical protein